MLHLPPLKIFMPGAGGGYVISGSALFDGSTSYLSRTPGSSGNRRTFVVSAILKNDENYNDTNTRSIVSVATPATLNDRASIGWENDAIYVAFNTGSWVSIKTNAVFRDLAAYYHIVVAVDTTQATAADRVRLWVNGTAITSFSSASYPAQNTELPFNQSGKAHVIGGYAYGPSGNDFMSGYLSNVVMFDGLSITSPETAGLGQITSDGYWEILDVSALTIKAKSEVDENADVSAYIGDMTATGGLTAIDDGSTTWSSGYASKNSAGGSAYVGWDWGSGNSKTITGFVIQTGTTGATLNWSLNTGSSSCTIRFYGSNSAPSNATDGTILKEFANTPNTSGTYYSLSAMSGLSATAYRYHWFTIICADNELGIGEAQLFVDGADQWGQNGFLLQGGTNIAGGLVTANTDWTAGHAFDGTEFVGDTGNFSWTGDDVTGANDKEIHLPYYFTGDCSVEFTIDPTSSSYGAVGFFDATEAGTLASAGGYAGMNNMTDSWFVYDNLKTLQCRYGSTTPGSFSTALGDTIKVTRESGTFKVYENDVLQYTFATTFTGNVGLAIGGHANQQWDDVSVTGDYGHFAIYGTITATNDSPTDDATNGYGNYATLDPNAPSIPVAYTNGNRTCPSSGASWNNGRSTFKLPATGKIYFEVENAILTSGSISVTAGLCDDTVSMATTQQGGGTGAGTGAWTINFDAFRRIYNGTSQTNTSATLAANLRLQVAVDIDAGDLWLGVGDTYYVNATTGTGDPSAGTNPTKSGLSGDLFAFVQSYGASESATIYFDHAECTGIIPTGFSALATQNITPPDVNPSEHAAVVLWENDGSSYTHTGLPFQPDFVLGKNRDNGTARWELYDVIRGATKRIRTDVSNAEDTISGLTAFTSDGFTFGTGSDVNFSSLSGDNEMALCLKAGGAGSTNTDGSITATVSANTISGFSIIHIDAAGTGANATVGHGLPVAPAMFIVKRLDSADNWFVYHRSLGAASRIIINSTNAQQTSGSAAYFQDTAPNDDVIYLGTNGGVNASGGSYVIYAFCDVADLATSCFRVGEYDGNTNADGTNVTLDCSLLFLLTKRYGTTGGWFVNDSVRDTYNPADALLNLNTPAAETNPTTDIVDLNSNGFKFRSAGGNNNTVDNIYFGIIDKFLAGGADAWTQGRAR